ncbi:PREDICTED: uncharacterized protein LOC108746822 isoform X2 [Trachymyrmex septentrionalis]|uniref:uncharacterized protein LOC108746822 isoform X2 n=1 Tax=Trachymyrmex septentrionalis TaxID=34720 RepID=UPI00084F162A|nr:PREDICTED: uncharacterized protein LOC108746822 isoform X2 [Trachymyrmex septentrionalis]
MQMLLKLILTYNIYFGCVIYEVLNFPKSCTARAFAINVSNYEYNIGLIIDSNDETKSDERRFYSDIYSQLCHRSIQRFTTDKPKRYWKNTKRNFQLYFQTSADIIYRRKLLGYEQDFFEIYPMRYSRFKRIPDEITQMRVSDLTKKKRDVIAKNIYSNEENIDWAAWDNWSIWSACSVSCGQGRQVRWRHCLSADCTKGLKKAQLKSCHLKDCGTKGILGWLGIKS